MGQMIRMSDFRKAAKALQRDAPAPDAGPAYYCMRCDADLFKLFPSGLVQCSSCGAAIRNILVAPSGRTDRDQ